ncbi:glycosyltransferase [Cereibacter sp. SYSU M97828]|nr:glycosyltransferase [Cereibacter flavus]
MADPAISVIVPIYRDWEHVQLLLDHLAAQDVTDFEVLLVDNDLREPPIPVVPAALAGRLRVLHCPTPGSYAARNLGAGHARGRLLVFTDADCRPVRGWLSALLPGEGLRAGPVTIVPGPAPNRWEIFDTVRGIPQRRFITRNYAVTANLAVPQDVFAALGGFDPARLSGGDAEFCRRAVGRGHSLSFVPEAEVLHPARGSRAALVTKARRIKGGQIASGPLRRRVMWTIRSLTPPVREIAAYLRSAHPIRWRLTASAVRMQLWAVELAEMVRLLSGAKPERR